MGRGYFPPSYIAGIGTGKKGTPLFRTARGKTQQLTGRRITQPVVYLMIRRRASSAGIKTLIGCHTFRSTGITASRVRLAGHQACATRHFPESRDARKAQ
jgi:hypothetical protein